MKLTRCFIFTTFRSHRNSIIKLLIITGARVYVDGRHNLHTRCCGECYINNFALNESLWTFREGDNPLMYSIS